MKKIEGRHHIFHKDNAPALTDNLAIEKCRYLYHELLEQLSYSPDLVLFDFYLFPNLRTFLSGKYFASNKEVIATVDGYFAGLPESY